MRDGKFFCERMPQWLCQRMQRRMDVDAAVLKREIAEIGQRYTEHLVFALHLNAFWFLALAATVAGQACVSGLVALAIPVNACLAMRRVYSGRWWPRLLRGALIAFAHFMLLSFMLVAVFLGTAIA